MSRCKMAGRTERFEIVHYVHPRDAFNADKLGMHCTGIQQASRFELASNHNQCVIALNKMYVCFHYSQVSTECQQTQALL